MITLELLTLQINKVCNLIYLIPYIRDVQWTEYPLLDSTECTNSRAPSTFHRCVMQKRYSNIPLRQVLQKGQEITHLSGSKQQTRYK